VRNAKRMILTPGKEGWPKNIPYLLSMDLQYENSFSFTASKGYLKT